MGYANNVAMLTTYHRQKKRKRTNSPRTSSKPIKANMNNVTINGLTYQQARDELLRPSAKYQRSAEPLSWKAINRSVRFTTAVNKRNSTTTKNNKIGKSKNNHRNKTPATQWKATNTVANKDRTIGAFRGHNTQMSAYPQLQAQMKKPTTSLTSSSITRGVSYGKYSQMMVAQRNDQHAEVQELKEMLQLFAVQLALKLNKIDQKQDVQLQQTMQGQDFASIPWSQTPEWLKKHAKQAAMKTVLAPVTVTKDLYVHGMHLVGGPAYNLMAIAVFIVFTAGGCFVLYNVGTKVPGFSHVTHLGKLGVAKVFDLIKFELDFIQKQGLETVSLMKQAGLDVIEGYRSSFCGAAGWKTKVTMKAMQIC